MVINLLISKKMRLLLMQLIYAGIDISVYSGLLVPMISLTLKEEPLNK